MNSVEKQLLENLLDAFDRLYDRKTGVADLRALMFALLAWVEHGPPQERS